MRKYLYEVLSLVLIASSLVFFFACVSYLARRDYVAALILVGIGVSVLTVGKELARMALVQKE